MEKLCEMTQTPFWTRGCCSMQYSGDIRDTYVTSAGLTYEAASNNRSKHKPSLEKAVTFECPFQSQELCFEKVKAIWWASHPLHSTLSFHHPFFPSPTRYPNNGVSSYKGLECLLCSSAANLIHATWRCLFLCFFNVSRLQSTLCYSYARLS